MKRYLGLAVLLLAGICAPALRASEPAVPAAVAQVIESLVADGGETQLGHSEETGVFVVAVARSPIVKTRTAAREVARMEAIRKIAELMGNQIEGSTEYSMEEKTVGDQHEIKEFFSSQTKTSVSRLMKGVQVAKSRRTPDDEMEVVVFVTTAAQDATSALEAAQMAMGDKGVVRATGVDSDRARAEQRALISAVEQVAGTMTVGKASTDETGELKSKLATTAGALVDEYRILDDKLIEGEYHVVVAARVSKRKIYESYRSYFKALDNPVFYVESANDELKNAFTGYFIDKGTQITENRDEAHYIIRLSGKFVDGKAPRTGHPNTMITVTVEVRTADGKTVLFHLKPKKGAKSSAVLTTEQRHEEAAVNAFKKVKADLDQAFHNMVIKMFDESNDAS